MTTPAERELARITPTELLLEPSCDQVLGSVVFRDCIANETKQKNVFAVVTGFWTVTPLTNITPVSLYYQSYLNVIFHRTRLAFYGHAITMPLVVMFLCAYADRFRFADADDAGHEWAAWINANFCIIAAFFVWYTVWGLCYGLWWLGPCAIPVLAFCYFGGHYYGEYQNDTENEVFKILHPMLMSGAAAFIQSGTHLLEDLPPRVSGSLSWTKKSDFLCRKANGCAEMVLRSLRLAITALVFGPFDEWTASPRLLPLFWSLWPVKAVIERAQCSCCGTDKLLDEKFKLFERALHPERRVEVSVDTKDKPQVTPLSGDLNAFGSICDWLTRKFCCETPARQPLVIANPSLDYVGRGGAAYMIVDKRVGCCDVLCCRYKHSDITLDAEAGIRQTWRLTEATAIGVAKGDDIPGVDPPIRGAAARSAGNSVALDVVVQPTAPPPRRDRNDEKKHSWQ